MRSTIGTAGSLTAMVVCPIQVSVKGACEVDAIKLKHDNANQACSVTYDDMISAVHVYGAIKHS